MSAAEIRIVKPLRPSPASKEAERDKADFDSAMAKIRFHVKHSDRAAGEYFFREMVNEVKTLARVHGFKIA